MTGQFGKIALLHDYPLSIAYCQLSILMRACLQRVCRASVTLPNNKPINESNHSHTDASHHTGPETVVSEPVSKIDTGLLVLLGVGQDDTEKEAGLLAKKISELRIFEDDSGKMNRSLLDIGGRMLVVSQFTLYADCRKGRRPSFTDAASPDKADRLYRMFVDEVRKQGIETLTGVFQTEMHIELVNDGPVTIWLDTDQWSRQ